jgi:hypothetical protein
MTTAYKNTFYIYPILTSYIFYNCYFGLYQVFLIVSSMVHTKRSKHHIIRNNKQYGIRKKKNIDLALARLLRWKNPG